MKAKRNVKPFISADQEIDDDEFGSFDLNYDFPEYEGMAEEIKLLNLVEKTKIMEAAYVSDILRTYFSLKHSDKNRKIDISRLDALIVIETELLVDLKKNPQIIHKETKEIINESTDLYFKTINGNIYDSFATYASNQLQYDYEEMRNQIQKKLFSRSNIKINGLEYHKINFTLKFPLICIYCDNLNYRELDLSLPENIEKINLEIEIRTNHIWQAIATQTRYRMDEMPSAGLENYLINVIGNLIKLKLI